MKIDTGASIQNAAIRSGRSAARPGAGGFAARLGDTSAARVTGGGPLNALGALIVAQAVQEPAEHRRRAVRRGGRLLDLLDEVRTGLLVGSLSRGTLDELVRMVGEARDTLDDPALAAVLDEIDLRAQVELAKYAVAA